MKLYMVSLGPGDFELITVKALRALKNSDAICVPTKSSDHSFKKSMTFKIVSKLMEEFGFNKPIIEKSKEFEILKKASPFTFNPCFFKDSMVLRITEVFPEEGGPDMVTRFIIISFPKLMNLEDSLRNYV